MEISMLETIIQKIKIIKQIALQSSFWTGAFRVHNFAKKVKLWSGVKLQNTQKTNAINRNNLWEENFLYLQRKNQ